MSLTRAFTTRRAKAQGDSTDSSLSSSLSSSFLPQRSNTTKSSSSIIRNKISAPLELVHTTNMLSYNAPDLPRSALREHSLPPVTTASQASRSSDNDSDTINTLDSTPPTSPDIAPGERSLSPDPSHLSTLFMAPGKPLAPLAAPAVAPAMSSDAPVIPKRSPSHTKKASYEAISRSQSISRASKGSLQSSSTAHSTTFSRSSSTSTSMSHMSTHSRKLSAPPRPAMPLSPSTPQTPVQASIRTPIRDTHPFGQELAQVSELVEEMTTKAQSTEITRDDAKYLASRGLASFAVTDYLTIVDELATNFFPESNYIRAAAPLWI